jgi:hypothetical protein
MGFQKDMWLVAELQLALPPIKWDCPVLSTEERLLGR